MRSLSRGLSALVSVGLVGVTFACSSGAGGDPAVDAGPEEDAAPVCPAMPTPEPFVKGPHVLPLDGVLRVSHVQAKATHNSYHLMPKDPIPDWRYEHVPLGEQLATQGVRGVELDIHWDDECQRYRVFHIGLLDDGTTCTYLTDCLVALRAFSKENPGHHPVFVQIEPKFASSPATDAERLAALDREVLSVFDKAWIVRPDDVKGASPSVAAGLEARGWPTLGEARGRFVFYLNTGGAIRDAYTSGRKHLDGKVMFAEGTLGEPFVGVQVSNGPEDTKAIEAALAKNVIVRTRADSNPGTVRAGDTASREVALASGAHIVSTDFPAKVPGLDYALTIPDGTPSRCNPKTAPKECTPLAIEDPSKLRR